MPTTSLIQENSACPRCDKSPLTTDKNGYTCTACKVEFPSIAGIPWLFAEPDASLGEWRNRLHFALQQLANDSQRIATELSDSQLHELTRQRLERQQQATDEHRDTLRDILSPIDIHSSSASYESYLALRTRLPSDQGIATYYNNVHRDWAWGDEENAASLAQINAVLQNESTLGDTLVLGAGACRLAYDVHMTLGTGRSVALDFNPLLLLIAQKVAAGETPTFHEFPIAPRTLDDFAVARKLAAPKTVREGFELVCADVLRPPFADGSFDTVITPWLIDIVNEDLATQAARINALLKPGGRWINFGSLSFEHPNRARRYSLEETLAIVEQHGFSDVEVHEDTIPYMCSPASRHGRQETTCTFAAIKTSKVKKPERHKALPDWIVTGKEPVPLLKSFQSQAMSTQIHAYIMSLINGKRTISDMAEIMQQQKLMTQEEAVPALRNFLIRMHDDSQRNSGF